MALKTNFTDDILAESMNGKRQYNVTENSNGTKSLEDVTDYQSVGSTFSAKEMNETNAAVNQAYDDMGDEFNPKVDYAVGDYTIRNNKVWKFTTAHPAGAWDESHVKATKILSEARELTEKTKEVYKSEAPFEVSQTVHMSCIENDSENSVYLISSYRYAFAGSMVLTRKDIVEGNWGEGFTIFAQNPEHYWVFKLTSNFDLTLVTNHECDLPYISVTRL